MYLDFFSFAEKPFDITPDTRFLYRSAQYEEVLGTLLYGIRERRGFIMVTGEVGTGKTTTLRALMNRLEAERTAYPVETSLVINPLLSTLDLIKSINQDFGIEGVRGDSLQDQISALNSFLLARKREGRNAVVIIDEAQDLSMDSLEMIRLLSNLETETHKLLQLILVGQPELDDKLAQPALRQLRQRVQIRYRLAPLDAVETSRYIIHRLNAATPKCCLVFQPSALKKMHELTGGVPRLINTLGELVLMAAYIGETHVITNRVVKRAYGEMADKSGHQTRPAWWIWKSHVTPS